MRIFPTSLLPAHAGAHIRQLRMPVNGIRSMSSSMSLSLKNVINRIGLQLTHSSSFGLTDPGCHMRMHLNAVKSLPKGSQIMVLDQGATIPNDHPQLATKLHHHWSASGATVARNAVQLGYKVTAVSNLPTSLRLKQVQPIDCFISFADQHDNILSATRIKLLPSGQENSIFSKVLSEVLRKDPKKVVLEYPEHVKELAGHCNVKGKATSVIVTPLIMPDIERDIFGLEIHNSPPKESEGQMDLVIVQHGGLSRTEYSRKSVVVEGEHETSQSLESHVIREAIQAEKRRGISSLPKPRKIRPPEPQLGDYADVAIDIIKSLKYVKTGGKLIYSLDQVPIDSYSGPKDQTKTIVAFLKLTKEHKNGSIRIQIYRSSINKNQSSLIIEKIDPKEK